MLHRSQPVDWEIFSIPPVSQPVQYYSILKKKREFSQLIKQYDPQVLKHGCIHYCGIVPKNMSSSLNQKYELLVIFFDDVPNTSFIGFRVKVSDETFINESNLLLLFLKKSEKAELYLLNNNSIHVQCGKNAWELFYFLYDVYLRQYAITVIGTQFFYHFVYSYYLQKEIQLYEMLFRGSKVIRVSKKSIYYRIHRKRKISVMDLIYMTVNMPDSKRYVLSFDSKESLSHTDFRKKKFYSSAGSKVHVSKLVLKKFKMQNLCEKVSLNITKLKGLTASNQVFIPHSDLFMSKFKSHEVDLKTCHLSSNNTIFKRKFEEIENDGYNLQNLLIRTKFRKMSGSVCLKEINQWEQYKNIKPYTIEQYSSILLLKENVQKLFNCSKSVQGVVPDSNLLNNHYAASVQNNTLSPVSLTQSHFDRDLFAIERTCQIFDHKNLYTTIKDDNDSKFAPSLTESTSFNKYKHLSNVLIDSKYNTLRSTVSNLKIVCNANCEVLHSQNNSAVGNKAFLNSSKIVYAPQEEAFSDSDEIFTTAGGKTINISNNAILSAQKFIQGVYNKEHQKLDESINSQPSIKKHFISTSCSKTLHKNLYEISKCNREMIPEKLNAACFKNISEPDRDDIVFSTAAGKTLTISNTAIKAVQKLLHNTFKDEQTETPSAPGISGVGESIVTNILKDTNCSSKKVTEDEINADMDKSLVEKFFQDTLFEEKEFKEASEPVKSKESDESKNDSNCPTRKLRKSLGGRRSMRFYSDKI